MEREKIKIAILELLDIVYGDSEEFDVISSEITGTFRHGNENTAIIQRISDKKYFSVDYRDSAKEAFEFQDMNFDEEYTEVFPSKQTIIIYK